MEKDG